MGVIMTQIAPAFHHCVGMDGLQWHYRWLYYWNHLHALAA